MSFFLNYLTSNLSDRATREALVRRYIGNLSSALLAEVSPVTPWHQVCEDQDLYCMSEGFEIARQGFVDALDRQCWDEARDIVQAAWENSRYQLEIEHEYLLLSLEDVKLASNEVTLTSRDQSGDKRYLTLSSMAPSDALALYRLVSQVIDEELGVEDADLGRRIPFMVWSYV